MMRPKTLLKLAVAITPAVIIVVGVVLKMGLLVGAGAAVYPLLLVAAVLVRVSTDPESGYGFHIQFRQGHQADFEHATRRQDQDRDR